MESSWDILALEEKKLRSNFERHVARPMREIAIADEEVRYTNGQRSQPKISFSIILDGFRTVERSIITCDEANG